jgi:hypothetical protein
LISKIGCGIIPLDIGKVSKKSFFHILNDISEEKTECILNTTSNNEISNLFEKIDIFCEYLVTTSIALILERHIEI